MGTPLPISQTVAISIKNGGQKLDVRVLQQVCESRSGLFLWHQWFCFEAEDAPIVVCFTSLEKFCETNILQLQ